MSFLMAWSLHKICIILINNEIIHNDEKVEICDRCVF